MEISYLDVGIEAVTSLVEGGRGAAANNNLEKNITKPMPGM